MFNITTYFCCNKNYYDQHSGVDYSPICISYLVQEQQNIRLTMPVDSYRRRGCGSINNLDTISIKFYYGRFYET